MQRVELARIAGVILLRDVAERRAAEALLDLLADLLDEGSAFSSAEG